jgi:hypothetical protein
MAQKQRAENFEVRDMGKLWLGKQEKDSKKELQETKKKVIKMSSIS